MARLPQLIAMLAKVDGRKMGTIEHGSRVLREAGLLTTGKRGAGAPEMTYEDAANLLIAVNGSEAIAGAKHAVNAIADLIPENHNINEDLPYPLPDLERQPVFGDALSWVIMTAPHIVRLIESFICIRYEAPYSDDDRKMLCKQARAGMGPVNFTITFSPAGSRLAIELTDAEPRTEWERTYSWPSGKPFMPVGDRRASVKVGLPTIIALHECISGESLPQFEPLESNADE